MADVNEVITEQYAIYKGDCIPIMAKIPDESIGLSDYSPPFGGLYHYSSSPRDLSNARDYGEFLEHYEFVISEIERITKPGRVSVVHCMDVPLSNSGKADYLMDFPSDITELHVKCRNPKCTAPKWKKRKGLCGHGWFGYKGRYHIWKEPLTVRNRTMAKKLAHRTIVEDSIHCANANADFMLVFQKKGINQEPITHERGLLEYYGARKIPSELMHLKGYKGNQIENSYSHWIWRQYASSFWDDVRLDRLLPYIESKSEDDEKHVHPLQLDAIQRVVELWSNPGDVVFTPFMGVGSEVWGAVKLGRVGVGIELKDSFFKQAKYNLAVVNEPTQEEMLIDMEEDIYGH